jgi:dipeptidyl aminopeptidase/acylaminoacyl peptidase
MIIHGDKDTLVPIQQAQVMDAALANAGTDHTLVTIEGGGHDAKTFNEGFPKLVAWFKEKLKK